MSEKKNLFTDKVEISVTTLFHLKNKNNALLIG